jgi:hypothetical protein
MYGNSNIAEGSQLAINVVLNIFSIARGADGEDYYADMVKVGMYNAMQPAEAESFSLLNTINAFPLRN